jgi:hypothetical protein
MGKIMILVTDSVSYVALQEDLRAGRLLLPGGDISVVHAEDETMDKVREVLTGHNTAIKHATDIRK